MAVTGFNGHLDGAQHGGVMGVEEGLQLCVLAVQCTGVLGQVVGADGEEVALGGQLVRDEHGGGGLDHGAYFNVLPHLHALGGQLGTALFQNSLGVLQLPQAGDHGEHDAHVAVGGSTQQRAQLGLEEVLAGQADADGTVAQRGVILVIQLHVIHGLICADITGAHHHLAGCKAFQHLLVSLELVVFGGEVLAVQVDELGAEQTHAAGVVLLYSANIAHAADVGKHVDGLAVQRGVGLALQLLQQGLLFLVLLLALFQALEQVGGGVHIHTGVVAVHHSHLAVPVVLNVLALDQGGDVHAACQNGGVAVGAALAGDEAQQQAFIHAHGLGGSQILGYQNAGLGALQGSVVHPLQNVQHGLRNVQHIGAAGLQIRVVHGREHRSLIVAGGLDGVLGAHLLSVDDLLDGVHKVVIIQHHGVDVEHLGDVLAGFCQCLFVQGGLLLNGLLAGSFKTLQFCGSICHRGGGNSGIFFLVDLQLANGDAIEYAFAGAYLHSTFSFHLQPGVQRPAFCQKSPRSFPARARLSSRGSDVLAQELLDGLCGCFFIIAFDLDGHGLALLDAHAHQSHQLAHIAALAVLLEGGGACKALHGLDQQAGGTGMDAAGILNSVLKFLHNHFLLT